MALSPELQQLHDQFLASFPNAWPLERALYSSDNRTPFFYFSKSTHQDLKGCWLVLGRLGPTIEKQFGITGEVLLLFTPFLDLQRRVFNALCDTLRVEVAQKQLQENGLVRFTPDPSVVLLASPDPEMSTHLAAWNLLGNRELVAPLPFETVLSSPGVESESKESDGLVRAKIISGLRQVLIARDLYSDRNPVTGSDFFGRQKLLDVLRSELSRGGSLGLFGLRRSGKTSVISEFRRTSRSKGIGVILSDLEAVTKVADLPVLVAAALTDLLRDLKGIDETVWTGSENDRVVTSFAELSSRIIRVAEKNPQFKFVIALDEVESLVPLVQNAPEDVRAFLGALRRASQTSPNVAILATGVTTKFFDESMLTANVENPLFGSFESHYLSPFSLEETTKGLRKIGKLMVLEWDDDALELLHNSVGGFPFFVRDLASAVRAKAHEEMNTDAGVDPITITAQIVQRTLPSWSENAARMWNEIVRTLELHHPMMAYMVQASDDEQIAEWLKDGTEAEVAARALENLGLLDRDGEQWVRTSALENLQSLGSKRVANRQQIREAIARRAASNTPVPELLGRGEDSNTEFKETARLDIRTGAIEDHILHSVLKTIAAFINTEGGTLLIGVSDDGRPIGIARDIESFATNPTQDGFNLWLSERIHSAMGVAAVSLAKIGFESVNEATICRVDVSPGKKLTELNAKKGKDKSGNSLKDERVIYVRKGASSGVLEAADVPDWMETHKPR